MFRRISSMLTILTLVGLLVGASRCDVETYNARAIVDVNREYCTEDSTNHRMQWNNPGWVKQNAKHWSSAGIIVTNVENVFDHNEWIQRIRDDETNPFKGTILARINMGWIDYDWHASTVGSLPYRWWYLITSESAQDEYVLWNETTDQLYYSVEDNVMFTNPNSFTNLSPLGWGPQLCAIVKEEIDELYTEFGTDGLKFGVLLDYNYQTWAATSTWSDLADNADPFNLGYVFSQYSNDPEGDSEVDSLITYYDDIVREMNAAGVEVVVRGDRFTAGSVALSRLPQGDIRGYFYSNVTRTTYSSANNLGYTLRENYPTALHPAGAMILIAGIRGSPYFGDQTQYAEMIKSLTSNGMFFTPGVDDGEYYFNYPEDATPSWWVRKNNDAQWKSNANVPVYDSPNYALASTYQNIPTNLVITEVPASTNPVMNSFEVAGWDSLGANDTIQLDLYATSDQDCSYEIKYGLTPGNLSNTDTLTTTGTIVNETLATIYTPAAVVANQGAIYLQCVAINADEERSNPKATSVAITRTDPDPIISNFSWTVYSEATNVVLLLNVTRNFVVTDYYVGHQVDGGGYGSDTNISSTTSPLTYDLGDTPANLDGSTITVRIKGSDGVNETDYLTYEAVFTAAQDITPPNFTVALAASYGDSTLSGGVQYIQIDATATVDEASTWELQTSLDNSFWITTGTEIAYSGTGLSETNHTTAQPVFNGTLYVRAIASDIAGNPATSSDSFVMTRRTPDPPVISALTVDNPDSTGLNGFITLDVATTVDDQTCTWAVQYSENQSIWSSFDVSAYSGDFDQTLTTNIQVSNTTIYVRARASDLIDESDWYPDENGTSVVVTRADEVVDTTPPIITEFSITGQDSVDIGGGVYNIDVYMRGTSDDPTTTFNGEWSLNEVIWNSFSPGSGEAFTYTLNTGLEPFNGFIYFRLTATDDNENTSGYTTRSTEIIRQIPAEIDPIVDLQWGIGGGGQLHAMEFREGDRNTILLGTDNGLPTLSDDFGSTFTMIHTGVSNNVHAETEYHTDIEWVSNNYFQGWAMTTMGGIFFLEDGTETWIHKTNDWTSKSGYFSGWHTTGVPGTGYGGFSALPFSKVAWDGNEFLVFAAGNCRWNNSRSNTSRDFGTYPSGNYTENGQSYGSPYNEIPLGQYSVWYYDFSETTPKVKPFYAFGDVGQAPSVDMEIIGGDTLVVVAARDGIYYYDSAVGDTTRIDNSGVNFDVTNTGLNYHADSAGETEIITSYSGSFTPLATTGSNGYYFTDVELTPRGTLYICVENRTGGRPAGGIYRMYDIRTRTDEWEWVGDGSSITAMTNQSGEAVSFWNHCDPLLNNHIYPYWSDLSIVPGTGSAPDSLYAAQTSAYGAVGTWGAGLMFCEVDYSRNYQRADATATAEGDEAWHMMCYNSYGLKWRRPSNNGIVTVTGGLGWLEDANFGTVASVAPAVAHGGYICYQPNGRLFVSSDNGETWSNAYNIEAATSDYWRSNGYAQSGPWWHGVGRIDNGKFLVSYIDHGAKIMLDSDNEDFKQVQANGLALNSINWLDHSDDTYVSQMEVGQSWSNSGGEVEEIPDWDGTGRPAVVLISRDLGASSAFNPSRIHVWFDAAQDGEPEVVSEPSCPDCTLGGGDATGVADANLFVYKAMEWDETNERLYVTFSKWASGYASGYPGNGSTPDSCGVFYQDWDSVTDTWSDRTFLTLTGLSTDLQWDGIGDSEDGIDYDAAYEPLSDLALVGDNLFLSAKLAKHSKVGVYYIDTTSPTTWVPVVGNGYTQNNYDVSNMVTDGTSIWCGTRGGSYYGWGASIYHCPDAANYPDVWVRLANNFDDNLAVQNLVFNAGESYDKTTNASNTRELVKRLNSYSSMYLDSNNRLWYSTGGDRQQNPIYSGPYIWYENAGVQIGALQNSQMRSYQPLVFHESVDQPGYLRDEDKDNNLDDIVQICPGTPTSSTNTTQLQSWGFLEWTAANQDVYYIQYRQEYGGFTPGVNSIPYDCGLANFDGTITYGGVLDSDEVMRLVINEEGDRIYNDPKPITSDITSQFDFGEYTHISPGASDYQFLVISDTQEGPQTNVPNIINNTAVTGFNGILHLGDNHDYYVGNDASDVVDAMIVIYNNAASGPVLIAVGNHDGVNTASSNGADSPDIIDAIADNNAAQSNILLPTNTEIPLSNETYRGTNWIWHDQGVWLVHLNAYMTDNGSNYTPWKTTSTPQIFQDQLDWVTTELAAATADETIIFVGHTPLKAKPDEDTSYQRYCTGTIEDASPGWINYLTLMKSVGATRYLHGHIHSMSVFNQPEYYGYMWMGLNVGASKVNMTHVYGFWPEPAEISSLTIDDITVGTTISVSFSGTVDESDATIYYSARREDFGDDEDGDETFSWTAEQSLVVTGTTFDINGWDTGITAPETSDEVILRVRVVGANGVSSNYKFTVDDATIALDPPTFTVGAAIAEYDWNGAGGVLRVRITATTDKNCWFYADEALALIGPWGDYRGPLELLASTTLDEWFETNLTTKETTNPDTVYIQVRATAADGSGSVYDGTTVVVSDP